MPAILITGVPGAGKTTVAKALAKIINYKYVNTNSLVDECNAILDVERDACGNPVKVVDMEKLEECFTKRYKDENVILEGVVVDFVPPSLVEKVIVLRVDPLIVLERLLQRGYCLEKACENAEAELIGSYIPYVKEKYGDKVYEVVCEEDCIDKVRRIIYGGDHGDEVDWIDRAEELLKRCNLTQTGFDDVEMKN